jgi:CheY-like chemotaxis protein
VGSVWVLAYNRLMEEKNPLATTALPGVQPSAENDRAQSGSIRPSTEPGTVARNVILVVDDSADNVAFLSLDLQQIGYRVVTATNGEEAVSIASAILPNLILMDISMPRLDGLGATRQIREIEGLREVPIIALTAFDTEGFKRAAYDVGVSGYLTKPIDFVRMHKLIALQLAPGAGIV